MYWTIKIKRYSHDRVTWHWAFCCRVESAEMLGIVVRALGESQELRVEKHEIQGGIHTKTSVT